jgi:hypothetical protein
MNNTRALTINKTNIITFLILLMVATLAPHAGNQFVTGTIVNCTLLITVATLSIRAGLLTCIIPSTIALTTGLLPVVLAPMIPFIILGDAVLLITFDYLNKINYWLGAITGSVLKFAFLAGAISIVTHLIINENAAASLAYMMS